MNRYEFISKLASKLAKLPDYEINRTISFYVENIDDRIEDGMTEEQAVASFGDIDDIIKEILIDTPFTTLIQNKVKESHDNSSNKKLWSILVVSTAIIWLPVALVLAAALFLVYISIWLVVLCLFASELCLILTGIVGVISGAVVCFVRGFPLGLATIGTAFVCIGLFIMTIKPLLGLCKQFIAFSVAYSQKIKKQFVLKKEGI